MISNEERPPIITFSEKPVPYNLHDTFWIHRSAKFVTIGEQTSLSGIIQINEIIEGQVVPIKEITSKQSLKCGTLAASSLRSKHVATGDFLGNINIWDIEHSSVPIYSAKAHKIFVMSIDGVAGSSVGCGAPEIVTGSVDGIKVWDPRQKDKPVVIIESEDNVERQCWTVAFGNSYNSQERVVCAGFDNGDVKIFDLRIMKEKWGTTLENGVCSIEFDRKDVPMNKFLVTGLEGMVCFFEANAGDTNFHMSTGSSQDRQTTMWRGRFLPQKRDVFATTSGSGTVDIWKYDSYVEDPEVDEKGLIISLQSGMSATQGINSFDWCPDKIGLAVCSSFDQTIRLLYISKLNLI